VEITTALGRAGVKLEGKTEEEAAASGQGVGILREEGVSREQGPDGLARHSSRRAAVVGTGWICAQHSCSLAP